MILLTGATGNVGSHVARELHDKHVPVRAFVRDPGKAREMLGHGIQLAVGDFADPVSIRRALDGVECVFLSCGNHPLQVEYETNAIDAAVTAGVRRIVKLSAFGAEAGSPLDFWDWQGRIEDRLRRSNISHTLLHPNFYMSNMLATADQVRDHGRMFLPADGAKIAMIDPRDVAGVAAVALTTDGHEGTTYVVTGPAPVTLDDVARELSSATGRSVEFVPVSDDAARAALLGDGMPDWFVDNFLTLFAMLRQGVAEQTTETVRTLTGRDPRGIADFARDNSNFFKP